MNKTEFIKDCEIMVSYYTTYVDTLRRKFNAWKAANLAMLYSTTPYPEITARASEQAAAIYNAQTKLTIYKVTLLDLCA